MLISSYIATDFGWADLYELTEQQIDARLGKQEGDESSPFRRRYNDEMDSLLINRLYENRSYRSCSTIRLHNTAVLIFFTQDSRAVSPL